MSWAFARLSNASIPLRGTSSDCLAGLEHWLLISSAGKGKRTWPLYAPCVLRRRVVLRVVADALMLNTLLIALALRLFYLVAFSQAPAELDYRLMLWASLETYAHSSWALTLLCLVVFALSGFYTYGQAYRGRYKVLIIVQAVSLAYILFDCLAYLSGNLFSLSRPVLVLALLLSVGCLIASASGPCCGPKWY